MKSFKKQLFEQFALLAKALANGNRLELLEFLAQRECAVEDLASLAGLSIANTSHHLQQLKQMGLVECRKEGQYVIYRLGSEDVTALMGSLRLVAERRLEEVYNLVQDYLSVKDNLEAVPLEELMTRARDGLVTVLDVRPPAEFNAAHLPGAINIPLAELESRLDELDDRKEIVAYCRGPHCILAFDAVQQLRQSGKSARRMDGGLPEWKLKGYPVVGKGNKS